MHGFTLRRLATAVICTAPAVALLAVGGSRCAAQEKPRATVGIVYPTGAESPVRIAARELAAGLGPLYENEVFVPFEKQAPGEVVTRIHLHTPRSLPPSARPVADRLQGAESYVVTTAELDGRTVGLIVGGDSRGVMHGVHGLLQKLGHGYYLGVATVPEPRDEPFGFAAWDLADRPLVPTRIMFNWHNFLTSASTWNLDHWRQWTTRSQKMGFNTIMVHAYGNNPMAGFRFRGVDKPVGYLSSTRLGRSWFVNHVNDVRRMHGGEVFEQEVFGSTAAVDGTDRQRTEAARQLMREVFRHAHGRGVDVIFALDIDTPPGNPQELITLLDESDRFQTGGRWLPNPDTPGGYAFYKAQVSGLLQAYPRIDTLALWHRTGGTPWMGYRLEDMPQAWQEEFDAACREKPGTEQLWHARHIFGMAKVARACRRALREIGREDVSLAFGSWHYGFLAGADRFMPEGVTLIPLDWMVLVDQSQLRDAESRAVIGRVAEHRPVLPVVWAHHDDGAYVMRPFEPFDHFQDRLDDARCTPHGYGIIHWMTRPLDLYFASLARQTWSRTRNEPLDVTCRLAAEHWFGREHRETLGPYLQQWVDEAPMFARETSDWFVDRPLDEPGPVAESMHRRLKLLRDVDTGAMRPGAKQRVAYFEGIERFATEVHRLEWMFRQAHAALAQGRFDEARKLAQPLTAEVERVIGELAGTLQRDGITRGEQGLIVTLNTRWLPHYVALQQRLALAPIRDNFGPTVHDPIAPRPGKFTLHFDPRKNLWQTFGEKETGAKVFTLAAGEKLDTGVEGPPGIEEIARQGLEIDQPLTLPLRPIIHGAYGGRDIKQSPNLPKGRYRLTLWTVVPAGRAESASKLTVTCGPAVVGQFTEPAGTETDGPAKLWRRDYQVTVTEPGEVKLTIEPVGGKVWLAGLVYRSHFSASHLPPGGPADSPLD